MAGVVLVENIAFVGLASWFNVHDAVLVAVTLVVFILITVLIVSRVAGSMGRALEEAEDQLVRKNEDLGTANEELTAIEEELRQNINELANAERTLRESEERFRTIAEVSPLHLSIARKSDGKILFTNPAYDKAFGYAPGELLGYKTPDLYYDPADREVLLGIFKEQGSVENQDLRVRRKDGSLFWINVSFRSILYNDIDSTLAASIDITRRKRAEEELAQKNYELNAINEELNAMQEELHQNFDELRVSEETLRQNEAELRESLLEKEALLSEIHHRVKNNLTAFISLLSLEGSYQDTPGGQALRLDLQNRARSMALVHETLYKTKKYSQVDMEVYLSTLVDQISRTFPSPKPVITTVSVRGVTIDIARATPCGLIINELMTNAYKHAFPEAAPCGPPRPDPCTLDIEFTDSGGYYTLTWYAITGWAFPHRST